MNNYTATPIPWGQFLSRFEAQGLGEKFRTAKKEGGFESAHGDAESFVASFVWDEEEESTPRTLGLYQLGVLANCYRAIREKLPHDVREGLDALYKPFVAGWLNCDPPEKEAFDLPDEMRPLHNAGLAIAMDPAHCQAVATAVADPFWETSVLPELLKHVPEAEQDLIMVQSNDLRVLVNDAAASSNGLIVVIEI